MVKNNKSTQNSIWFHQPNFLSDSIRDNSFLIEKNYVLGCLRLFASNHWTLAFGFRWSVLDYLNQIKIVITFQHFCHTFFVPKAWREAITNNRIPVRAGTPALFLHQNPQTLLAFIFSTVFWTKPVFLAIFALINSNYKRNCISLSEFDILKSFLPS
jgi:hypothetical protein